MFADRVFERIQSSSNGYFGQLAIEDVCTGALLTAVRLSNGYYGVASTMLSGETHQPYKKNRDYGDFTPLKIIGQSTANLFSHPKNTALVQSLKIATLNACFQESLAKNKYSILNNTDPVDLLDLSHYSNITMVGAFSAYIRKIAEVHPRLQVLELSEEAFLPEHKAFFVPAEDFPSILPTSDLIIITGLTLVNNTFDGLLEYIPKQSTSILIGPSASIPPELFFENHISLIGATRITHPDRLFPLVSQGAAGYHLFEYCAEKITLRNE